VDNGQVSKISVEVGVDNEGKLGLNLFDNLVGDQTLDQRLNEISNLGNTFTFEINGNVVLVNDKVNISAGNSWGQKSILSYLGFEINSEVSNNVSDVDLGSS